MNNEDKNRYIKIFKIKKYFDNFKIEEVLCIVEKNQEIISKFLCKIL